ncbi:MAG: DUF996 domain-containing protein [Candidatus Bathyarchaeota archaeon]|jgi:uncharacterized membrane protein|nr:DUF996 domain-containing protein [Candidatus Bathyarchaeota archaeon]
MTFESSKNLSAIGALLMVIGFLGAVVPYAGILGLIGLILLLIGMKGLSNFYNEQGIFNNALYSIISAIVGGVVALGAVVILAVSALASLGIDLADISDWATLGTDLGALFTDISDLDAIFAFLGTAVVGLIILFVFAIISMYFFRKSMNQLSSKSGIGLFGTAGILMLVGAVLTIAVVGLILIWIGLILATIGFFQMKE